MSRPAPASSAYSRYVALGDSFTEGVGDPDPARPNGVRGWADRVAQVLSRQQPEFGYANLAIRGRKIRDILDEQIEPAVALSPDLVTMYAGANDVLRPKVDLDDLVAAYDDGLARLRATGARVLVWTAYDPGDGGIYGPTRGRFAIYNELVRESAERHGADVVDFWRMREYRDPRFWDVDRMHMGPIGHQRMAIAVLNVLHVDHGLEPHPVPDAAALGRSQRLRADAAWMKGYAGPWVHRRLTGRSSGDGLSPRYPDLSRP